MQKQLDGLLLLLKDPEVRSVLICSGSAPVMDRGTVQPVPGGTPLDAGEFGKLVQSMLSQKQQAQLAAGEPVVVERPVPDIGLVRFALAQDSLSHMLELRRAAPAEIHIEVPASPPAVTPHCPVCRHHCDPQGGTDVACPRCHTLHHADCWSYNGGCGLYACNPTASAPPPPAAPPPHPPRPPVNLAQIALFARVLFPLLVPLYVYYQFWNVSRVVAPTAPATTSEDMDIWPLVLASVLLAVVAVLVVKRKSWLVPLVSRLRRPSPALPLKLSPSTQFLLGALLTGGALFGLSTQQRWIQTAWSGPVELPLSRLASLDRPARLPSPWVTVTFTDFTETGVGIQRSQNGSSWQKSRYLLGKTTGRWMIVEVPPRHEGLTVTGYLDSWSTPLRRDAVDEIGKRFAGYSLYPFQMDAVYAYRGECAAMVVSLLAVALCGIPLIAAGWRRAGED